MGKTNRMHYLSQCISINFLPKEGKKTFWEYNPTAKKLKATNIKNLFSSIKPWSQELENVLSGNNYENKLATVLKELCNCPITRNTLIGLQSLVQVQFNGVAIEDRETKSILSKLLLQGSLLQKANSQRDFSTDDRLAQFFENDMNSAFNIALMELNPAGKYPPLLLTDGLPFIFLTPSYKPEKLGHVCFMIPISQDRLLLFVSYESDVHCFCKKFHDINFLNLCRIEQHDENCRIASANKQYLEYIIPLISNFSSNETIPIRAERKWR